MARYRKNHASFWLDKTHDMSIVLAFSQTCQKLSGYLWRFPDYCWKWKRYNYVILAGKSIKGFPVSKAQLYLPEALTARNSSNPLPRLCHVFARTQRSCDELRGADHYLAIYSFNSLPLSTSFGSRREFVSLCQQPGWPHHPQPSSNQEFLKCFPLRFLSTS